MWTGLVHVHIVSMYKLMGGKYEFYNSRGIGLLSVFGKTCMAE